MKNSSQPHWILQEIADQRASRVTINLWPQIASRLDNRVRERKIGLITGTGKKPFAWLIVTIILLVTVVVAVPQARASVSSFFQRIGMEFTQPDQGPENTVVENIEPIRITPPPSMTLDEIRQRFPYKLLVPNWLPEDLALSHAGLSRSTSAEDPAGSPCVRLVYRTTDASIDDPHYLSFQISPGECSGPFLLPATKEQLVDVNGQPGSFVKGGWRSDGKGDPETTYRNLQWDDSYGDAYLAWKEGGLNYFIAAFELDLTREEMLQIAESIQEP
jgi:hypothetical protein